MKKILTLIGVSILGGAITLGAYKLMEEDKTSGFSSFQNKNDSSVIATSIPTTNLLLNADKPNLINAANETIDAVVHVKNKANYSGPRSITDLFYGRSSERSQVGTGSGVIISPDGYIITNNHVIAGASEISITLNNNRVYEGELIGSDEKTDIALIKIEVDEKLPAIQFGDSDNAQIGEWVLAVGNPFNLTSTVTAGIISAKSRDLSGDQSFIQTDAAVNPGNSGGALVNTRGELIGINTAITSQTGSYIGYSFAVPSNIARKIVEDLIEFGNVQTGILGVSILNRNAKEAIEKGINEIEGVYVTEVTENSGAEKAGIESGDIIKRLDNIEVTKFSDLSGYLKTKRPNDIVNVEVLRNDEFKVIPVKLTKSEIIRVEFMNMTFRNIPKSLKENYDITNGVIIEETENRWLYNKIGIREGYIITAINDEKIESISDINTLKERYGSDFDKYINRLEYIDRNLNKKEVIFR